MKAYTDIEQSKKLSEILPIESANMHYAKVIYAKVINGFDLSKDWKNEAQLGSPSNKAHIPCWSLAALLKYLSEIKPQIYTQVLFPSEGKWILQFVEYGNGNVCEVSCDNLVDACVETILKLHELNLL